MIPLITEKDARRLAERAEKLEDGQMTGFCCIAEDPYDPNISVDISIEKEYFRKNYMVLIHIWNNPSEFEETETYNTQELIDLIMRITEKYTTNNDASLASLC